jgi:hypothetical protein
MQRVIWDLDVHNLRAHLDSCRTQCATLAQEFEKSQSSLQRTRLARRWDAMLKHAFMVQFLVDLLERCHREGCSSAGCLDHLRGSFSLRRIPHHHASEQPPA